MGFILHAILTFLSASYSNYLSQYFHLVPGIEAQTIKLRPSGEEEETLILPDVTIL